MSQTAKAQEPSMEEILASIRRIIADDDASKPPAKAAEPAKPAPAPAPAARPAAAAAPPPPRAPSPPPEPAAVVAQDDIDAMFSIPEPAPDVGVAKAVQNDILELTESMEAPPESAPAFRRIDGNSDLTFNEAEQAPEPAAVAAAAPTVDEARRQF